MRRRSSVNRTRCEGSTRTRLAVRVVRVLAGLDEGRSTNEGNERGEHGGDLHRDSGGGRTRVVEWSFCDPIFKLISQLHNHTGHEHETRSAASFREVHGYLTPIAHKSAATDLGPRRSAKTSASLTLSSASTLEAGAKMHAGRGIGRPITFKHPKQRGSSKLQTGGRNKVADDRYAGVVLSSMNASEDDEVTT